MKHVFIVNPMAGKHSAYDWVRSQAEAYFKAHGGDFSIFVTHAPLHATQITREIAKTGEPVRFYAVGGDGTLNEVITGAFGCENAEVAAIPAGSGDDYIKNFGSREEFLDIASQIEGLPQKVDLVRCGDRLSCNICSVGFDAEVAYRLSMFRRTPGVSGGMAYLLSMFYCLIRKVHNRFEVQVDDHAPVAGDYLLISCPNGVCYGGGFRPVPTASVTDGELDFLLAKSVSRLRFLTMVSHYRKGELEKLAKIITRYKGKRIRIRSQNSFAVNLDGEVLTTDNITFELLPRSLSFVLPRKVADPRGVLASNKNYQ